MAQGNEFVTSGSIAADGSFTDAFNQTYDSEQYPVGTLRYQAADEVTASDASLGGDRLWMFVKASSAGVSANDLLERDSTSTAFQVKTSSATNDLARILVVGVAQNDIAADEFGWVVVKGECVVKSASVSAGNLLASKATAGTAEGSTTAGAIFGYAISDTGSGVCDAYVDLH
ncbi:MAG: hypothetical protein GOVbin2277_36 [Prokaryotic dsDNA virus sp.]|jgi:hypothetical protein|nr:MAG: hypothetical protein GOVbin2277_36 [Prokaryotic dsDNA virus sp.]|tara:strand:- start:15481 stop:15999 length:519 start_codon:yes stop_codon:yes gene_type:complete